MKIITILKKSIFLVFLLCVSNTFAQQPDWKWGEDELKAKEKWTLLSDDISTKSFKTAKNHLAWLLVKTPDLNKSLYMKGAEVYEALVKETEDADLKSVYEDSALVMYDLRIKYFQDEANVLNRKGGLAMTYLQDRPEKYPDLFELYTKIIELNGKDAFYYNVNYAMYLAAVMFKNEQYTEDQVIELHKKLTEIVEHNMKKNDDFYQYWEKAKEYIDSEFSAIVTMDCEKINKFKMPKLAEDPENVELIEEILALMLQAKCLDNPKFLELSTKLATAKPTFGRYSFLYKYYLSKDDTGKAIEYMKKAEEYAENNEQKADLYITQAKIYQSQGNKSTARDYYKKAAATDASKTYDAYTAIGDMYLTSSGQCTVPGNPVHSKGFAIAAYNAYNRAGNGAKAAQAKQYFPRREEAFTNGGAGETINVGCWIGETVTIPALDQLPK